VPTPVGYSRTQIVLHWAVVVLVAQQFLLKGGMEHAWRAFRDTGSFQFSPLVPLHVFGGMAILVLVLARIVVRRMRGAPEINTEEHPALRLIAQATHSGLYVLLILLAISGSLAWFGGVAQSALAHKVLKTLVLALVVLHVAGALVQHFYLKSDSLRRMTRAS
jgi:cytochrome b561